MCDTCGCGEPGSKAVIRLPGESNQNNHDHNHDHEHDHNHHGERRISVESDILSANNLLAERNRGYLEAMGILAINIMSSPGSGKTSLLEKTIIDLRDEISFFVIEGDQQTLNDAQRIESAGAPAVQINTGNGCHLDADMVNKALKKHSLEKGSVVMIENVGNLICPSLFFLGEKKRVVIMSVTEGEDKPVKYPAMFESADLCLINKTDLLPYLEYDLGKAMEFGRKVNHQLHFIEVSAKTGQGMERWYEWLRNEKSSV
ncbi:MAG TPA: hydrogenase nickel incorporation protein HypB [Bacteroidales bacterium]|nr:hydrogenase nickel incorporation protein HypB [Bacteroidales bacterium]